MREYEGIQYHERHAAINVKVYEHINLPEDHEPFAERAFESIQEQFWEEAREIAHTAGYSGVFSQGRSGGWLVPYRQRADGKLLKTYCGQGGGLGFPQYPNMDNIGERSKFRAFQRKIEAMMQAVPANMKHEAEFLAEQEREEAAQS